MANGHGGARTPSNPAPVSGPGAMSRRTDGAQPARYASGMPYGDGQDFYDLQTAAPMADSSMTQPSPRGRRASAAPTPTADVTPLYAPTTRPDEPVTAGAARGPGPNSVPMPAAPAPTVADSIAKFLPYDQTGDVARLYMIAKSRGW